MSESVKAYQATPGESLERQIMDPNIPKNEREWWAAGVIERLRARTEWKPTETAPRDGSVFLAVTTRAQYPTAAMCKFSDEKFLVLSSGEKFEGHGWAQWWPTHWMPLPSPPKPSSEPTP